MFYHYHQNNSGGSFDIDDNVHIDVIIEADNTKVANRKAEEIGIYFGGEGDCECCGDRWSAQYNDESGDTVPTIYGEPVETVCSYNGMRWADDDIKAYVYYADGRKEVVKY